MSAFVYCYLFSAGFRHDTGILDGLYRKSLVYWMGQHSIERISGPFLFHFYMLSWYESLFVIAAIVQLCLFFRRASSCALIAGGISLFAGLAATLYSLPAFSIQMWPWSIFKLKGAWEILSLILFIALPIIITTEHLLKGERALAFWGYFFYSSLFTYSYLGEKVPWLSVYPFLPGLVYLTLYFQHSCPGVNIERIRSYPWGGVISWWGAGLAILGLLFAFTEGLFAKGGEFAAEGAYNLTFIGFGLLFLLLGLIEGRLRLLGKCNLAVLGFTFCCLFVLRASVLTNFVKAGQASEYISQVHTTKQFHDFALSVRRQAEAPTSGRPPTILGIEDVVWPITWYMVDIPQFKFSASEEEKKTFDYVFQNEKAGQATPPGFLALTLPLRGWWVPDFNKMTLKRFLNYAFNHTPWSTTGFSNISVLVKERR